MFWLLVLFALYVALPSLILFAAGGWLALVAVWALPIALFVREARRSNKAVRQAIAEATAKGETWRFPYITDAARRGDFNRYRTLP